MLAKIIISSPLQLLNALEAKHHFNVKYADISFVSDGNNKNEKQISQVLKRLDSEISLSLIRAPKHQNILSALFFLRTLKEFKEKTDDYDIVILGHFRSIYQATLANLYSGKKILVDDGSRSLDDLDFLNSKGYESLSFKLKRLVYRFFSVHPYLVEKRHTFFSYYAPNDKINNHIDLIPNKFSFIRKLKENNGSSNKARKVAFIGQGLVDSNLIEKDNYEKLIRSINAYYKEKYNNSDSVEYFAHRNESEEILEFIKRVTNWKIMQIDLPLELHLLLSSENPMEIGLFFSSLGETLSIIFDNRLKLTSFYIEPSFLLYRQAEIESMYKNFKLTENTKLIRDYIN